MRDLHAERIAKSRPQIFRKNPKNDTWKSKYKEPEPVDTEGLPELPHGWAWASVGELTSRLTNGYVGPTRDLYRDSGVPYLLSKHVRDNQLRFDGVTFITSEFNEKNSKSKLRAGDVLLVQTGHVGESAVVPQEHEGHNCHALIVLSAIAPHFGGDYLSWFFNSPSARERFLRIEKGMTLRHLNCGDVKFVPVPVPPAPEQKAIVAALGRLLGEYGGVAALVKEREGTLSRLNKAILAKAFRGELVPQDPNDEPASVLLERIRADREPAGHTKKVKKKPAARKRATKKSKAAATWGSEPGAGT